MQRGTFAETTEWHVELLHSKCYWHEQTEHVIDTLDRRNEAAAELLRLKQAVAEHRDQRFIYFICSRKRIRFSPSFRPQYSSVTRQLTYYLEVGEDRELTRMTTPIRTIVEDPEISFSERVLSYQNDAKRDIAGSVHEFHHYNAVSLGFASKVHYIGASLDRGLVDTLRNVSRDESDIFHYYNLFKVDPANLGDDGRLLEDVLVYYFKPDQQIRNEDVSELKSRIVRLGRELQVGSVGVTLQSEFQNEYFRFFSAAAPAADAHRFWLNTATGQMTTVTDL